MINPAIEPYMPRLIELFKTHKVKTAYVFGSVLTAHFSEHSDVDFLINFQEGIDPVSS